MIVLNDKNIEEDKFTAITLGNFDGIHLGHQKLIFAVKSYAKKYSLKSVVFSFFPHPKSFFNSENFYTIFSPCEKKRIIGGLGIDELIEYPFNYDLANVEPENFADFIFDKMKCKVLVVGDDYCFGKNRRGNFELLKETGGKKGAEVIEIYSVNDSGIRVSSTRIRKCIGERNFEETSRLLGKPYFVSGKVVDGKKIGREINFPTANIIPYKNKLLPPDGVYLTKTTYNNNIYKSITNIGKNPTVEGKERTVETHIFDIDEDLYGKDIEVRFYGFIRNEDKFSSIEDLKKQISKDKEKALEIFDNRDLKMQ